MFHFQNDVCYLYSDLDIIRSVILGISGYRNTLKNVEYVRQETGGIILILLLLTNNYVRKVSIQMSKEEKKTSCKTDKVARENHPQSLGKISLSRCDVSPRSVFFL